MWAPNTVPDSQTERLLNSVSGNRDAKYDVLDTNSRLGAAQIK
jgi:hypothetical protein